ncbi:uncharacterized protein [Anabrus simplex]|uniref:uncharacterized protein n=1 Tax=Anabrus simplex TaxID=316456 RepID=UPI0034DD171F
MDEIIQEFLETNDNLEIEPLGVQKDLVGKLYTKCLQTALRDARLRDRASKNKHLLENVKLSVETYMHHIIYKKLIKGITGCTAYDDAQLNKIIRNLSDVQLRDLGVRADLYETVPWAKQELARVDGYGTVLGKIGCLRRMVASISKQNSIDGSGTHNGLSNAIAADDLLPMIVFLVIKAGLPNWIAHLNYMKQFHFSVSSTCQVDEDSFLVTSLEAAIEHIKSGILLGPSDPEAHIMNDSEFMSESTVFLMKEDVPEVQADGITGVMYFFEQIIFGPMFSGKTTELIRRLKRYQIANYRCLIVKYANDVRYSTDGISTHDKQTLPAVATDKLIGINAEEYDVIGIDEGQFFNDVVRCCEALANQGKIVIVAALDGTYQRIPFGDILNLVPLAEDVIKLHAVCMNCFRDASYTKRISNEQELEVIGGADKYMAVCRECHFQNVTRNSPQKYQMSRSEGVLQDMDLNCLKMNLFGGRHA